MNQDQNKEEQNAPSTKPKQLIRSTNAGDFITNGQPYQVYPDGIPVSKTKLVRNIPPENRHKALYATGLNTLALNPHFNEDVIFNCLNSINKNPKQINIPLPPSELIKITANIFKKRKEEGELVPDVNHTRKIIFDDAQYPMTKQEKKQIIGKEVGKMKSNQTKMRIYEAIEGWDKPEKITIKGLSLLLGKGCTERTIKKYYSEFKVFVKGKNDALKAKKQAVVDPITHTPEIITISEPIQQKPSDKVYDSPEEFRDLVRQHSPTISIEMIKHYYNEMFEMKTERTEANIRTVLMI